MPTYAPHKNKYKKHNHQPKRNRSSRSSSSSLDTPDVKKLRHKSNTSSIQSENIFDYLDRYDNTYCNPHSTSTTMSHTETRLNELYNELTELKRQIVPRIENLEKRTTSIHESVTHIDNTLYYLPERCIVITPFPFAVEDDELWYVNNLLENIHPHIKAERVKRLSDVTMLVELPTTNDRITILKNKAVLKNSVHDRIHIRAAKTHAELKMEKNIKTLLRHSPDLNKTLTMTRNGWLEEIKPQFNYRENQQIYPHFSNTSYNQMQHYNPYFKNYQHQHTEQTQNYSEWRNNYQQRYKQTTHNKPRTYQQVAMQQNYQRTLRSPNQQTTTVARHHQPPTAHNITITHQSDIMHTAPILYTGIPANNTNNRPRALLKTPPTYSNKPRATSSQQGPIPRQQYSTATQQTTPLSQQHVMTPLIAPSSYNMMTISQSRQEVIATPMKTLRYPKKQTTAIARHHQPTTAHMITTAHQSHITQTAPTLYTVLPANNTNNGPRALLNTPPTYSNKPTSTPSQQRPIPRQQYSPVTQQTTHLSQQHVMTPLIAPPGYNMTTNTISPPRHAAIATPMKLTTMAGHPRMHHMQTREHDEMFDGTRPKTHPTKMHIIPEAPLEIHHTEETPEQSITLMDTHNVIKTAQNILNTDRPDTHTVQ